MSNVTELDRVRLRHKALKVIEGLLIAKITKVPGGRPVEPMSYFQNISLDLFSPAEAEASDWFIFEDTSPRVIWPIDVSFLVPSCSDDPDIFEYTAAHVRSATLSEVRGKAPLVSRYMAAVTIAGLDGDFRDRMSTSGGMRYYCAFLGDNWSMSQPRRGEYPSQRCWDPNWPRIPSIGTGIALRQRYEWAVSIGRDDGPSVRVAVDPTAIKELFRYRDANSGSLRRSALMTWVSDHWRQTRKDPEIAAYVRKHLRGERLFRWEGLNITILPPEFDMDLEDRLIEQREAMRASGGDRKVRAA